MYVALYQEIVFDRERNCPVECEAKADRSILRTCAVFGKRFPYKELERRKRRRGPDIVENYGIKPSVVGGDLPLKFVMMYGLF